MFPAAKAIEYQRIEGESCASYGFGFSWKKPRSHFCPARNAPESVFQHFTPAILPACHMAEKTHQLVRYKAGGQTYEVLTKASHELVNISLTQLQPGAVLKFRAGTIGWADVLYHDEICFLLSLCLSGCLTAKAHFQES
jgi:hypothetical protein